MGELHTELSAGALLTTFQSMEHTVGTGREDEGCKKREKEMSAARQQSNERK